MDESSLGWLTTRDAATLLGVSDRQVRYLVAEDKLPAARRGKGDLFRRAQLEVMANGREARKLQRSQAGVRNGGPIATTIVTGYWAMRLSCYRRSPSVHVPFRICCRPCTGLRRPSGRAASGAEG